MNTLSNSLFFIFFLIIFVSLIYFITWCINASKPLPKNEMLVKTFGSSVAESTNLPEFPNRIWTYWHDENPPLVVKYCIANWQRLNPDYCITMVTAATISQYVKDIPINLGSLHVTKQADWLRLALLNEYGGIWLDSSIILTEPIDNWLKPIINMPKHSFFAFYLKPFDTNKDCPLIENWFLAAKKGDPFIKDWLCTFRNKVIDAGTEYYLESLKQSKSLELYASRVGDPSYHTMHVVAQELLWQKTAQTDYFLALSQAETNAYKLQAHSKWRRLRLFWRLLVLSDRNLPPLIKLRGGERRKLEWYLVAKLYRKKSTVGHLLCST